MTPSSARKKPARRPRLTHFEIRRAGSLRLRLAVADDALADVGDELGALIRKIAPAVRTRVIEASAPIKQADDGGPMIEVVSEAPGIEDRAGHGPDDFVGSPQHRADDAEYHAGLRARLAELFGSLCDASLDDALEIVRDERARRAEGGN